MEEEDTGILDVKAFCLAFACSVTKASIDEADCVARNGEESLFGLMKTVFPQVGQQKYEYSD
jgi:hypothetical protein